MSRLTKLLSFEEQLTFYASYHHNTVNKIIHVVFVPTILWSVYVWLSNYSFEAPTAELKAVLPVLLHPYLRYLTWTAALPVAMIYLMYYILLEPVAGILLIPFISLMVHYANVFVHQVPNANWWALAIHVFSWCIQFVGHGVFENRAPALFDSLIQALLLAPMFVWMEILFALGYRPKLRRRLDERASAAIAKWKSEKTATSKKRK